MTFGLAKMFENEFKSGEDAEEPTMENSTVNQVIEQEEIKRVAKTLAARFFPGIKNYCVGWDSGGKRIVLKLNDYGKKARAHIIWENIDYTAPLWVNALAFIVFFLNPLLNN